MAMDLTQSLEFLAAPFVASLILTGIHAYLGVHVVERGVIFVDLSLAQIAALGATIALLLPWSDGDPHAPFGLLGQPGVHLHRRGDLRDDPGQARAHPAGSDHRHLLRRRVGRGDPGDEQVDVGGRAPQGHARRQHPGGVVARSAARRRCSTASIGLFHYVFRKPFLAISMSHDSAEATRPERPALGLPVLRVVRLRRDLVGRDRRRAAGVLLPDRAVGRGDAVRREHRPAAGDRLDDGDGRVGAGRVAVAAARPADRRDDRLHVRPGADPDGAACAAAVDAGAACG